MRDDKEHLIIDLTFEFALKIIKCTEKLRSLNKFEMASQLLKSGTSIGTNSREAQNAECKSDFIHKMKIAAKEADETDYWLKLCTISEFYPNPEDDLLKELDVIIKALSKIISSSKLK